MIEIIDDSVKNEKEGCGIARKKREWYPHATYYLMERGIRRQPIFTDEMDYQVFQAIARDALKKKACKMHAYCMMTNHFHMLLETDNIEIGKFMKHLASNYANYFNRKYAYSGHVFEGRYKACIIKDDSYFLQTSRYISLNPVKAKMVEHPEDYPWSSYRTMIGISDDRMTETCKTREYSGNKGSIGYREFVEDVGHRYEVQEKEIKKSIGEDDLWLPW